MPFSGPGGVGKARVQLEQISPKRFKLLRGFRYEPEVGGAHYEVTPEALESTDLTSVPFLFRWFVNSYGRHTLPSLLHDCLVRGDCAQAVTGPPGTSPPTRSEADHIFLEALRAEETPWIRRRLIWSAVTFSTRFSHSGPLSTTLMILWILGAVAGTALFVAGVWFGIPLMYVAAGLAPIAATLLWGPERRAGIWLGYGVIFLLPAAIVVLGSYLVYWLAERALNTPSPPSPKNF